MQMESFAKLQYERPDFDALEKFLTEAEERVKNAASFKEVDEIIVREDELSAHVNTMATVAMIRRNADMSNAFYAAEEAYIDRRAPEISVYEKKYLQALVGSKYRAQIEEKYGKNYMQSMELSLRRISEKNVPLRQRENELCNEYSEIIAGAKIPFRGEEYNLQGLEKAFASQDREERAEAWRAYAAFFENNDEKLGNIFNELVKVRTQMGRNLGYENYVPLGYAEQQRIDYNQNDVAAFRKQVQEVIVPLCSRIYELQKKRLGLEKIEACDQACVFADGNAVPVGDAKVLAEKAREVYREMSEETGEFIDFLLDRGLVDLENRPDKMATGFMAALDEFKAPFVFSCFNGTTGDADVLTHEAGHAFAAYEAMRTQPLAALYGVPTDIAEIHSMSMEQFAYPYAEKFFGDGAEKYRIQHLQEAITFVPFGVAVDEFQHRVYEQPDLTNEQRHAVWKELEQKYMPWRSYEDGSFFDRGGWWYHKIHIFLYPFYYINYTLTTMGALEFKKKMHENKKAAWEDYTTLCKIGGSLGYKDALRAARLSVPFESGSVKKAVEFAANTLLKQLSKIEK